MVTRRDILGGIGWAIAAATPVKNSHALAVEERRLAGIDLCWCPPGRFRMGSPRGEPERRPDEYQVEVTLTQGFWIGKHAVTQGLWQQVMGPLPGPLSAGAGEDFPVYNLNYAEA